MPTIEELLKKIDSRLSYIERYIKKDEASEHWLTPAEAQKLTGWTPETLRKKYYAGDIQCRFTKGRKPKYLKEELEQFIQQ